MLAVTRLEKWRVLKARNNERIDLTQFEGPAGVDLLRPHTTAQGWNYRT